MLKTYLIIKSFIYIIYIYTYDFFLTHHTLTPLLMMMGWEGEFCGVMWIWFRFRPVCFDPWAGFGFL